MRATKLNKSIPEPVKNTITLRLECNNFNAIDKEMIGDWLNWLNVSVYRQRRPN